MTKTTFIRVRYVVRDMRKGDMAYRRHFSPKEWPVASDLYDALAQDPVVIRVSMVMYMGPHDSVLLSDFGKP